MPFICHSFSTAAPLDHSAIRLQPPPPLIPVYIYLSNLCSSSTPILHFSFLSGWLVVSLQTLLWLYSLCIVMHQWPQSLSAITMGLLCHPFLCSAPALLRFPHKLHCVVSFLAPWLKVKVTSISTIPARGFSAQHNFLYSAPCFSDPLFCFSFHSL